MGEAKDSHVGSPRKSVGLAILGVSVFFGGLYLGAIVLYLLYAGTFPPLGLILGIPFLLLLPFFWFSPLGIPAFMIILASAYSARTLLRMSDPVPPISRAKVGLASGVLVLKGVRIPIFFLVLIVLGVVFVSVTYAEDYNAIQSIEVSMNIESRQVVMQPPKVNFTILIFMRTSQPASEETKITGVKFSLIVDSQQAGTTLLPFESQVGGFDTRDIAYDTTFTMIGSSAATVLQHNPNDLTLTVEFLAKGLFYQQQISKTLTAST